jgi:hypothetical protein
VPVTKSRFYRWAWQGYHPYRRMCWLLAHESPTYVLWHVRRRWLGSIICRILGHKRFSVEKRRYYLDTCARCRNTIHWR